MVYTMDLQTMKKNWKWLFGIALILTSAVLYYLQTAIYHDLRNTTFYILQDIAFIPIQVLFVTIIFDQLLSGRERAALLKKMNMVIGAFFSEVGNDLLKKYFEFDGNSGAIRNELLIKASWGNKDYALIQKKVKTFNYKLDCRKGDLNELKDLLFSKKAFLLRLLENPNLLEHDSFTDLLWAVFHLSEELEFRTDLLNLSKPDADHISLDMKRAYVLLIFEWLSYMKHLKNEYPYLYSLSLRMNPFDPYATAEIN
jgi:hypothetical protein